ncbi:hypothetical protein GFY24_36235 [Nocardia sp. SYP-A9097]|uniref:hypothetical protein n=1 Tax=Nocardia sp. SYP-A9097 TaxID=2663237 RepID=UPI00129BF6A7|nr:hypothetical protein [Nocardia sp. SYP-A9097]MRH92808.1 hypothetical protein [Nocardia sp. SYP-A9097]
MTGVYSRLDHHPVSDYRVDLRYPHGVSALLYPHRHCIAGPGHNVRSCGRLRQLLEIAERNEWHWAKRIVNSGSVSTETAERYGPRLKMLEAHTVAESESRMTQTEAIEASGHHRDCNPPCERARAASEQLNDDFGPKPATIFQFPDRHTPR